MNQRRSIHHTVAFALLFGILLCITWSAQFSSAAKIEGTVYTYELSPAKYCLLSVNTTPQQQLLIEDGSYNISLPIGTYRLHVAYYRDGKSYEDSTNLTIVDEGTYTYDFIVFPENSNSIINATSLPIVADLAIPNTTETTTDSTTTEWTRTLPALSLIILLITGVILLGKREWWKRKSPATPPTTQQRKKTGEIQETKDVQRTRSTQVATTEKLTQEPILPTELKQIISIIEQEGGRTTQKELRRHIPYSEAKISMMLTELEHHGKIKRVKKGRANLIILVR